MEEILFTRMSFDCPADVFVRAYTGEKDVEKAKQLIIDNDWFLVNGETIRKPDLDYLVFAEAWVECMSMQEIEFNGITALEIKATTSRGFQLDFTCDVCDMPEFLKDIYELAKQP